MSGLRVKRKSFESKVQPIQWQDCLLPKPNIAPPILVDFLGPEWKIVAWDGEILQTLALPSNVDAAIKDLQQRYPNLQIPDHILDQLLDE